MGNQQFSNGIEQLNASGLLSARIPIVRCEYFEKDGFIVDVEDGIPTIKCNSARGFFAGIGVLLTNEEKVFHYERTFLGNDFGYLIDCSRNAVPTLSSIKKLLSILAISGYTYIELYTEDTYKIDGENYFGHGRGAYSPKEIAEIVSYAENYGIEVVPCIETLAHLDCLFKSDAYLDINDINDIILCGDDKSYDLIDKMIETCKKSFKSNRINIGCDEAHLTGAGRYTDKFGYKPRFEIIAAHLKRVVQICKKHGLTPYSWGDMFFREAFGGYLQTEKKTIPPEIKKAVPDGLRLMHWDYYNVEEEKYSLMFEAFKELGGEYPLFATGAWKWTGFAPGYGLTEKTALPALRACAECGVKDVLVTGWGDDGAEASLFSSIGSLILLGTADCDGEASFALADKLCSLITGYTYSELKDLGSPDKTYEGEFMMVNSSKYTLYNDVMTGAFDMHIGEDFSGKFKRCAQSLNSYAERKTPFSYIFETLAALCEADELKSEIACNLRKAYLNGDKDGVGRALKLTEEAIEKEEKFLRLLRTQWMKENKPFGFDVLTLRIGGQIYACKNAYERLRGYLSGEVDRLEELEEERLTYLKNVPDVWPKPNILANKWRVFVTSGNL